MAETATEIWKQVVGFPDYEVSSFGHVRSLKYGGFPRTMATKLSQKGYVLVQLRRNGRYSNQFVHKLVLEAFVGPRPKGHVCKWKNGRRVDNKLKNIQWVRRRDAGIRSHPNGKEPTTAKLTPPEIRKIYRSRDGLRALAERYDVSTSTIWRIRSGRTWQEITSRLRR